MLWILNCDGMDFFFQSVLYFTWQVSFIQTIWAVNEPKSKANDETEK